MRTDLARVEQSWAKQFPNPKQYMEWYKGYRHSVHGMIVLDENGQDRLALGDAPGFERSGYGVLTVQGKDRVVLGLDDDQGEGIVLELHDGGHRGLMMRTSAGQVFLGSAPPGHPLTEMARAFHGLLLKEGNATRTITAKALPAP